MGIEKKFRNTSAMIAIFGDIALAVLDTDERRHVRTLTAQVIFRVHRKAAEVFLHLFPVPQKLPPGHALVSGMGRTVDQADVD